MMFFFFPAKQLCPFFENLFLKSSSPQHFHAFVEFVLRWILLWMPEPSTGGSIGQELLLHEIALVGMSILVVLSVTQL